MSHAGVSMYPTSRRGDEKELTEREAGYARLFPDCTDVSEEAAAAKADWRWNWRIALVPSLLLLRACLAIRDDAN